MSENTSKRKIEDEEVVEPSKKKVCDNVEDVNGEKNKTDNGDNDDDIDDSDLELLAEDEEQEEGDKGGDEEIDSDDEEDEEKEGGEFAEFINNEIQVEFSAYDPDESDFHGIKCLLQRLWLKEKIDLSELTNLLISEETIASVLKQDNEDDDDDANESGDDAPKAESNGDEKDDVYGITSLIPFNDYFGTKYKCIQQMFTMFSANLSPDEGCVIHDHLETNWALVINERFINLPPKISIPCYEQLVDEVKKEVAKTSKKSAKEVPFKYDFENVIMVAKLMKEKIKGPDGKGITYGDSVYVNGEDEYFSEKAYATFEYSVAHQCDPDCVINWGNEGSKDYEKQPIMEPFRKIMLFHRDVWFEAVKGLKDAI